MPRQPLYLQWRPATFDAVVGQMQSVRTLHDPLKGERIRHAYPFG